MDEDFPISLPLTYVERSMLISTLVAADISVGEGGALSALLVRLSRLECMPGGCEYCTGNSDESGFHVTWEDER